MAGVDSRGAGLSRGAAALNYGAIADLGADDALRVQRDA